MIKKKERGPKIKPPENVRIQVMFTIERRYIQGLDGKEIKKKVENFLIQEYEAQHGKSGL